MCFFKICEGTKSLPFMIPLVVNVGRSFGEIALLLIQRKKQVLNKLIRACIQSVVVVFY